MNLTLFLGMKPREYVPKKAMDSNKRMNWANCHTNAKKNVETVIPAKHSLWKKKLYCLVYNSFCLQWLYAMMTLLSLMAPLGTILLQNGTLLRFDSKTYWNRTCKKSLWQRNSLQPQLYKEWMALSNFEQLWPEGKTRYW